MDGEPVNYEFGNPPFVETAIGIQFEELADFRVTHFGLFHERIRERFPVVEDQPRLPRIVETFPRAPRTGEFSVGFGQPVRTERVFFRDAEQSALLQLQRDRFGFNWSRIPESEPYRRFSVNGPRCLNEFREFVEFCDEHGLGTVKPDLCEVVYVNHILPNASAGESVMELFGKVFVGLEWKYEDFGTPETASFNRVFPIPQQRGRVYAEASLARLPASECILFKVTGRVLHRPSDELAETLRLAHDWAVNAFVRLTDPGIRKSRWGEKQ